jgi:5S rRNA maturation endonuclease (ribonuclease M5)
MRHRLDARHGVIFIIVEGKSDKQALSPHVIPDLILVSANGKANALGAFDQLSSARHERLVIVVDCDGEGKSDYLGKSNLIFTDQRDVEADSLHHSKAALHVAADLYLAVSENMRQAASRARAALQYSEDLSAALGTVLDSARSLGLKVRVQNAVTHTENRISVVDLPPFEKWLTDRFAPPELALVTEIDAMMSWPAGSALRVTEHAALRSEKSCRMHGKAQCLPCRRRNFANGHETIAILSKVLSRETGEFCNPASLSRDVRLAARNELSAAWPLLHRMRRHEAVIRTKLVLDV